MRNADVAMYGAKGQGRNKYGFFAASMHTESLKRLDLENNLRAALAHEDFEVYYQPQLDIHSGQIGAVESLVRWRQENWGVVPPSVFIPQIFRARYYH